jgi:Polyketide cyclase / dehydrase and lipid transport
MFTTVALVLLAVLTGVLGYAATRPSTFRIERATTIEVAPEVVFRNINDLRRWEAWSPWDKIDPDMQRHYSGTASGAGAVYGWNGNKKVGSGRLEIIKSMPFTGLRIKLDFTAPFVAHNIIEFTLTKDGDSTHVSWAMSGPQPFASKLMGLVLNIDRMVGNDFAKGLAQLKRVSEGTGYTQLMR